MTTFSQLVDDMVLELVRPDYRDAICSYVNQTIREIHMKPNVSSPIRFDANRDEDVATVNVDDSFLWQIPSATRFQAIEAIFNVNTGRYIEQMSPAVSRDYSTRPFSNEFWYRSGPFIAIAGQSNGDTLNLSYFQFPQTHTYKAIAGGVRKVRYDNDTDSYVLIAGGGAPSQVQLDIETNWMIQRWGEAVIKESVRSKVWKRAGDGDRARMSFSAYESGRLSIWSTEPSSGG